MKYPVVALNQVDERFMYSEYHLDKEKGAFIEIIKSPEEVRIKIDKFSMIMFYFTVYTGKLFGATKFDLLLNSLPSSFPRNINEIAVIEFIRTNTMIGNKTFLKNVRAIPPGHELVFNNKSGEYYLNEWFRLPGDIDEKY